MKHALSPLLILMFACVSCSKSPLVQERKVKLFSPSSRSTTPALNGNYHSDCSEYFNEDFTAYARSDYHFTAGQTFEESTSFYLDSACQVPLGQFQAEGTLNYDAEGFGLNSTDSVLQFRLNFAKLRIQSEQEAVHLRGKPFCQSADWEAGAWKNITNLCGLGRQLITLFRASEDLKQVELNLCYQVDAFANRSCSWVPLTFSETPENR